MTGPASGGPEPGHARAARGRPGRGSRRRDPRSCSRSGSPSGSSSHTSCCPAPASGPTSARSSSGRATWRPRVRRLLRARLLRRLHAGLPVRPVARRRRVGTASASGGIGDLIKLPPILADLAIGWLVWSMARELGARRRLALLAAALVVAQPDHLVRQRASGARSTRSASCSCCSALRELWRDRPGAGRDLHGDRGAHQAAARRSSSRSSPSSRSGGRSGRPAATATMRRRIPSSRERAARAVPGLGARDRPARSGSSRRRSPGLSRRSSCRPVRPVGRRADPQAPFVRSGLLEQVVTRRGGYPYVTVNAYNPWALVARRYGLTLATTVGWICDAGDRPNPAAATAAAPASPVIGPLPAVVVGTALLLASSSSSSVVVARRPDRLHDPRRRSPCSRSRSSSLPDARPRALPVPVLRARRDPRRGLAPLAGRLRRRCRSRRSLNMYVVLTTIYDNPAQDQRLAGHRPLDQRRAGGHDHRAWSTLLGFVWALVQLRADGRERLARRARRGRRRRRRSADGRPADPGQRPAEPSAAAAAFAGLAVEHRPTMRPGRARRRSASPRRLVDARARSWARARWACGSRARFGQRPVAPDRSAALAHERGGRLDRLDLWLLVVLVVATLGLRTFRLAEP